LNATITGAGTFTVDAAGDPEPIVVPGDRPCHKVEVWEGAGLNGFKLYQKIGGAFVEYGSGARVAFRRNARQMPFDVGEILGYMATLSETATFSILATEEPE